MTSCTWPPPKPLPSGNFLRGKGNLGWQFRLQCGQKAVQSHTKASPAVCRNRLRGGRKVNKGALRMGLCVRLVRGLAIYCVVLGGFLVGGACLTVVSSGVAVAQSANSIVVEGNRRVEAETVRTYFKNGPGGRLGPQEIDEALKSLYGTGLFADVHI